MLDVQELTPLLQLLNVSVKLPLNTFSLTENLPVSKYCAVTAALLFVLSWCIVAVFLGVYKWNVDLQ